MQGPGGCHRLKTFDEAEQICNNKGYRMCSLQEVKEGRVRELAAAWIPKDLDRHPVFARGEGECLIVESERVTFRGTICRVNDVLYTKSKIEQTLELVQTQIQKKLLFVATI